MTYAAALARRSPRWLLALGAGARAFPVRAPFENDPGRTASGSPFDQAAAHPAGTLQTGDVAAWPALLVAPEAGRRRLPATQGGGAQNWRMLSAQFNVSDWDWGQSGNSGAIRRPASVQGAAAPEWQLRPRFPGLAGSPGSALSR